MSKLNRTFVYGTLKSGGRYRNQIEEYIHHFEKIKIVGTLFKVSPYYPGMILEGENMVPGELLFLNEQHVDKAISIMDGVEGYSPVYPEKSLFVRKEIKIKDLDTYIYVFNKDYSDCLNKYKVIREWINYEEVRYGT